MIKRREFLMGSVAAVGSPALRGQAADQSKTARVAVMSYGFNLIIKSDAHPDDPRRTLDILDFPEEMAARYGLHHVEIQHSHLRSTEPAYFEEFWTRPGYLGFDVLTSAATADKKVLAVPRGDPASFEAVRIETGVPAMGRELTEKTIPQEAGELVQHTVSFTKGCFTGQELVARLDARGGNVAWRLRGVVLQPTGSAKAGSTLSSSDREIGRLTSVAWSPGLKSPVALGYVRRDVVPPAMASVGPEGGTATIRELPLQIG